jgi:hypothetical protein
MSETCTGPFADWCPVHTKTQGEKPGHVVLPVEDVRQAVEALDRAADQLETIGACYQLTEGDDEINSETLIIAKRALSTLRKHLEGLSR